MNKKEFSGSMTGYILKKIISIILCMLFLSAAVFTIASLAPGDPLRAYYGDRVEKMNTQERELAEEKLGLNSPLPVRYAVWLQNAVQGNFGISYRYKTDSAGLVLSRLPYTLALGGTSFLLILILSPALALYCCSHKNKASDRFICKAGILSGSIPEFWLALLLIVVFSLKLNLLPASGVITPGMEGGISDRIAHLILPVFSVTLCHLWYYTYILRCRLIEESEKDYFYFARSMGIKKNHILLFQCLPNALPSFVSIMALSVPHIIGGTYVAETVFSYPGLGMLSVESAADRDINLLMLLCLTAGFAVLISNAAADIINRKLAGTSPGGHLEV